MTLPARLGRFSVLRRLATGGMAEVLLGRLSGPQGFERLVVIKRILPHLAREAAFVTMFVDEARLVARIRHPNVVQVYELGSEGDELFLVLEYLEGEPISSLQRALARRGERLDASLIAHVGAEACAGLHAAHELTRDDGVTLGLVHRDVSPQNLFACFDGRVKVLDFGIAKSADASFRTRTGEIKGKHAYMSPEQCKGDKNLTNKSDLYSLGIVLYELLTLRAITEEAAPRPASVEPSVPPALDRVIARALALAPADRYPSALEMRADL
ncbi:MAG TPA: serine/threonine-protein kinase, partial [Minicystis sp.]|nr:serine/threonine-protein kinase [Minicystis sp.]